jgi:hypothetical protein
MSIKRLGRRGVRWASLSDTRRLLSGGNHWLLFSIDCTPDAAKKIKRELLRLLRRPR